MKLISRVLSKFVDALPKTKTGKILRRVLRKIAENKYDDLGNLNSVEDASCISSIIEKHKSKYDNGSA